MIDLLHQMAGIAVSSASHSFRYAGLFVAASSGVAALYWRGDVLSPVAAAVLATFVLVASGVPYATAVLHTMLRGEALPFRRVLTWRRRDADFLLFAASSFLFGGMLTAIVAEVGATIYGYTAVLADRPPAESEYGYEEGMTLIALFGSRTFAAGFFIAAFLLWAYFFRTALRMPAHIDGFNLSAEEAKSLTRSYSMEIMASSLLLNTGLSAAAAFAPWGEAEWWARAVMAGVAAWGFLHFNLALSAAMYQKYTAGYRMRPLRIL